MDFLCTYVVLYNGVYISMYDIFTVFELYIIELTPVIINADVKFISDTMVFKVSWQV